MTFNIVQKRYVILRRETQSLNPNNLSLKGRLLIRYEIRAQKFQIKQYKQVINILSYLASCVRDEGPDIASKSCNAIYPL